MPLGAGLTFDVDSIRFDRAMTGLVDLVDGGAPVVVKTSMRLLLKQVINKFTPPKTLAQGRKAVKRDIGRAMNLLDDSIFHSKKIATLIRNKDVNGMREIVRRVPKWKSYTVEEFNPDALHEKRRDRRGRIQRSRNVFVLDKKGWKRYVRGKQKSVGSAKAGYWPGYAAVGGEVPAYVSRHASRFGSVDASKLMDTKSPRIRVVNFSDAARSQDDQNHSVQSAVKMRARSMESNVRRLIAEAAKKSGLESSE